MQSNSLRRAAAEWLRANCAPGQLQRNFLYELDLAQRKHLNCAITIGKAMTKRGKPYLVHFHAGEMFVFELSPRQAKNFDVRAKGMSCTTHGTAVDLGPTLRPVIEIKALVVDHSRQFILGAPITGRCSYSLRAPVAGPLAVDLQIEIPCYETLTTWHIVHQALASAGTLELAFAPLRPTVPEAAHWRGTTAAFARICAEPDPHDPQERLVPLSNPCCVLLDIVG